MKINPVAYPIVLYCCLLGGLTTGPVGGFITMLVAFGLVAWGSALNKRDRQ
jgi:hypothetical protein